jgi:hypothetical protein
LRTLTLGWLERRFVAYCFRMIATMEIPV